MRGRDLFRTAFIALATQVLRWLVVFAANLTCDSHIIVVRCMVCIGIRREHLGRLRLLESSNNFPMPRGTLSCIRSISSCTVFMMLLFRCRLTLRLITLEYGRFMLRHGVTITAIDTGSVWCFD